MFETIQALIKNHDLELTLGIMFGPLKIPLDISLSTFFASFFGSFLEQFLKRSNWKLEFPYPEGEKENFFLSYTDYRNPALHGNIVIDASITKDCRKDTKKILI